jgi:hypothetical protein
MTPRLTLVPPLASAGWAARKAPALAYDRDCPDCGAPEAATFVHGFACEHDGCPMFHDREAQIEAIWNDNMARRDATAAEHGEPETPREFYRGRPGSQAEAIVLNCLRALQAIPEIDRRFADELMDVISKVYLDTSPDGRTEVRRANALLKIARKGA